MKEFLEKFDNDLKKILLARIRDLWTHSSTAIEGNTLTLGETSFVLNQGLTISGKPLKDHEEVKGHAAAIDILYDMTHKADKLTKENLFDLHKAVMLNLIIDIYQPVGKWKVEHNGTYHTDKNGKTIYKEYPAPDKIFGLMEKFIDEFNSIPIPSNEAEAIKAYAKIHIDFTCIHPFADGNGRMARLLSNIPLLKAGMPPLVIKLEDKKEYLEILSQYDYNSKPQNGLFLTFLEKQYQETLGIIKEIEELQKKRQQA